MISAFGVEHGEISKGAPSAIRAMLKTNKMPKTNYGRMRMLLNAKGRMGKPTEKELAELRTFKIASR